MPRPKKTQPSYLHHSPSGQARVRIAGQDYYLGPHGSPESWQKYYALLGQLKAGNDKPEKPQSTARALPIADLIAHYLEYAREYYGASFRTEQYRIKRPANVLLSLYAADAADEFSPLKLKRALEQIALNGDQRKEKSTHGKPLSIKVVNECLWTVQRIWKWAASEQLVPAQVHQALLTVEPFKKRRGKLAAMMREPGKVPPVSQAEIDAVLPHVQPEIATMIQVQRLTGMRPDEVTIMRPADIEQRKPCWVYRPQKHKNDWREGMEEKEILLGPKAQTLLSPWFTDCAPRDYLFSPRRVAARVISQRSKKPGRDGARARNFAKLNRTRPPRECYDDASYAQAVQRACRKAGIDEWTPGRLRHTAATEIRARYGAEAAKVALGHSRLDTTEIYAERDRQKYAAVMVEMG